MREFTGAVGSGTKKLNPAGTEIDTLRTEFREFKFEVKTELAWVWRIILLAVVFLFLTIVATRANATPSLTLTPDRTSAAQGTPVTWTITASAPAGDPPMDNLTIRFKPSSPFVLTEAVGPLIISNQAKVVWDGGSALSNIASLRVEGRTATIPLVGGEAVVPVGTLEAGQAVSVQTKGAW